MRKTEIERITNETQIRLSLNVDGTGLHEISSGIGFLDHMLELFAVHSGIDLSLTCHGDTYVDFHHSTEDIGIALGSAFKTALSDKKGIARFADRIVPMDESVALVAIDISGRPYLVFDCGNELSSGKIGDFDAELVKEFLQAFSVNAGMNIYVKLLSVGNKHHEAEAIFKALAKCISDAVKIVSDKVPSSKGVLQ